MKVEETLDKARNAMTVKRVYGEAIEKDGMTVIPVANVRGGGGGGGGSDAKSKGSGVGFGVNAEPAGVYVIKDGDVEWQPALNLNRVIMGGSGCGGFCTARSPSLL